MDNYDDIINLPHHVSKRHPQMSMWNRAAQFAPFAALTGYSCPKSWARRIALSDNAHIDDAIDAECQSADGENQTDDAQ